MKKAFPGDPEFSWDRFYQLPYEYVLSGYYKHIELYRAEMHDLEMPTAVNTAVYANSQRDSKSKGKPFEPLDFAVFKPLGGQGPSGYYAACYVRAIELKKLPHWALFCYKEVASSAVGTAGPQYALLSEDAILIGPTKTETGFKGLLIAQETASGQVRAFSDPDGNVFELMVPLIQTKVIAKEGVVLS